MKKESSNNNLVYVLLFLLFVSLLIIFSLVKDKEITPFPNDGNNIIDDGGIIPVGDACGVTTCHGLDITCGDARNLACTEMYQVGDGCLQFASCEEVKGKCVQAYSEEFTQCKTCVQNCINRFDGDSQFDCESSCISNIQGVVDY